jgi:hypothetical protein
MAIAPGTPSRHFECEALLAPAALLSWADALTRPCPSLAHPGVYAWYFDEAPPGVPVEGCHTASEHVLLYVGIAPKETVGAATKPSRRTLGCRMRDHFRGNAAGSTLRLTLGCLLAERLGIALRRVGSGRRITFTNAGELTLGVWMTEHARVALMPIERPWEAERYLLSTLAIPLNLQGNAHPFVSELKRIRREAKARAMELPIVADNGGARRLPRAERDVPP